MMKSVCVYCGANKGNSPHFIAAAEQLGNQLAEQGLELVYGGGSVGLMGIIADAALAAGGRVTGVITKALVEKEVAHHGLTELIIVDSMHERKAVMVDRADGFIAMPGGFGTLDELFETLTWGQLGIHAKPCGLLNLDGYFDALLEFFETAVEAGFVRAAHRDMVQIDTDSNQLLDKMRDYTAPSEPKWNR